MTDGRHGGESRGSARRVIAGLSAAAAVACSAPACTGVHTAADEAKSNAEYLLASDAFKSNNLRDAYDRVQKALKLNPDNADAAYLGALVMLRFCAVDEASSDCRFKDAETFARKTIELAPEHRDAKNVLGVVLVQEKRYDDAIAVLKPLTEDLVYASPENAWGNLGWAYLQRGSVDEAIDALRRALAVQPLFCVGNYRLGLAYEKKGDLPAAREAFTKAVETDQPQCKRLQDAFGARARVLARQGFRDEARSDLQRCRDMAKETPTGQKCAAQLQTYQ
jgi:Tfp pilus assembly protein PilF